MAVGIYVVNSVDFTQKNYIVKAVRCQDEKSLPCSLGPNGARRIFIFRVNPTVKKSF